MRCVNEQNGNFSITADVEPYEGGARSHQPDIVMQKMMGDAPSPPSSSFASLSPLLPSPSEHISGCEQFSGCIALMYVGIFVFYVGCESNHMDVTVGHVLLARDMQTPQHQFPSLHPILLVRQANMLVRWHPRLMPRRTLLARWMVLRLKSMILVRCPYTLAYARTHKRVGIFPNCQIPLC